MLAWVMNLGFAASAAGAPSPTPSPTPTPTAGGRGRRRKYIEIDGQHFEVRDAAHAQALLDRAREVAVAHAQELAQAVVPRTRKVGKRPVPLRTPSISSPDPELASVIREARKSINEVYRSAAIDTELALLLSKKFEDEDDEDVLLLLM